MRIDSRRWAAAGLAVLVGLASGSCETADDLIPNTAGVFVVLRDASLGFQTSPTPKRQFTLWRVEQLSISIAEQPEYSYLPHGACTFAASAINDGSPGTTCSGSALTLAETGLPRVAIVRVDISGMETFSARRPSLPDNEDYDGDGVANKQDNCKLVPNPGQEIFGEPATGKAGIACSALDAAGNPILPDQDNDGVRDSFDNCFWYPNPLLPPDLTQTDTNRNGIGDLCEVEAPISLGGARLSLACPGTFLIATGIRSTFVVDFTNALSCDENYGVCSLDPTMVTMRLASESVQAATPCVDVSSEPSR